MSESSTTTKDVKILWSRSAGRCAMEDCRKKLTLENSEQTKSITLGQMCHIVGEKNSKNSPRGISRLPVEERNNYSNLILLCAHHHIEIDKNEGDWPVEILHKIKDDHEIWVEETLSAKKLTPEEVIYSTIVDQLDKTLKLPQWDWFMDNAVRAIVPEPFVHAAEFVNERKLAIIWPGKIKELEVSVMDLMASFSDFMHHFLKLARLNGRGDFLHLDRSYKQRGYSEEYDMITTRNALWVRRSFQLLCLYTCNLNNFAQQVRRHLNPMYHVAKGNFLINDSLGTHNGGEPYHLLPSLKIVRLKLESIDQEIKDFETSHPEWTL